MVLAINDKELITSLAPGNQICPYLHFSRVIDGEGNHQERAVVLQIQYTKALQLALVFSGKSPMHPNKPLQIKEKCLSTSLEDYLQINAFPASSGGAKKNVSSSINKSYWEPEVKC